MCSLEKLPKFENYARRFDKSLSKNTNDKIAYNYYVQQSIRNVLRRLVHRFDDIKRILQDNNLLPPQKDVIRLYFLKNQIFKKKKFFFFCRKYLGILKMLRDSAMERFLTTPLEEREKVDQMKSLNTRLSSNEAIIAKLEKELNDAIAERDSEVSKKKAFVFLLIIKTHIEQKNVINLHL